MKDGNTHEQETTYTYDSSGRLGTVADATDTFTYGYLLESNLVETLTSPTHTVTNTYETSRNVLDTKKNEVGSTLVSGYDYTVNALGQRTDLSQTGTAFATARSIAWGYDSLGQATKADSSIPGLDRAYQYDMIGNRLKSADSLTLPANNNYTVNALNQYTAVDSNSPTYDDDGNATAYPLPAHLTANSTLVWDAENRLTGATVSGIATSYAYDSQGRRIATVTGATTTHTIYDGWNPITKYSGATLDETYLWGMDLSGSMQGAGGVAGLLSVNDGNASYYPTYDGNGNVSEYLNSAGSVQAHYEYDPFGKTTVATGTKAQDFAHRFSTKPLDTETGLYYYGYRYYDPVTGRWPSRDPIGENGGINLYGFVGNNGVNHWDYLGMQPKEVYEMSIAGATPIWQPANNPFKFGTPYRSLSWRRARKDILTYFDKDRDGKLTEEDCPPFRIRMVGYSWGGWSALILVRELAEIAEKPNEHYKIALGTLDPVNSLRGSSKINQQPLPSYVIKAFNVYQTNGMRSAGALGSFFAGLPVAGASGVGPGGIEDVSGLALVERDNVARLLDHNSIKIYASDIVNAVKGVDL